MNATRRIHIDGYLPEGLAWDDRRESGAYGDAYADEDAAQAALIGLYHAVRDGDEFDSDDWSWDGNDGGCLTITAPADHPIFEPCR